MVAVILADAVDRFANATPITKPPVLSYGRVSVDGSWA
jgi:hypothetical protein